MKVELLSIEGEKRKELELPSTIFAQKVNGALLWEAARMYLARKRRGTASTKRRDEVRGSGRKLYRQKHTGRARVGDAYSPIRRGGGVPFGPKPRDFSCSISMSKKKLRAALVSALSEKASMGAIKVIEEIKLEQPNTRRFSEILKNLDLNHKKTLFLLPELEKNIKLSARNIPKAGVMQATDLNAYEVMNYNFLVFTEKGLEKLLERYK